MTIIQPNKNRDIMRLLVTLGSISVGLAMAGVFVYLQTVNAKHDLARIKEELEIIKVENAELKNSYYEMVDTDNLERLAEEKGFVKDKNPQWALASPF